MDVHKKTPEMGMDNASIGNILREEYTLETQQAPDASQIDQRN